MAAPSSGDSAPFPLSSLRRAFSSPRPVLLHLNGDTTWLVSLPLPGAPSSPSRAQQPSARPLSPSRQRQQGSSLDANRVLRKTSPPGPSRPRRRRRFNILLDPWLSGPQSDVAPWFSTQWHVVEPAVASIQELEEVLRQAEEWTEEDEDESAGDFSSSSGGGTGTSGGKDSGRHDDDDDDDDDDDEMEDVDLGNTVDVSDWNVVDRSEEMPDGQDDGGGLVVCDSSDSGGESSSSSSDEMAVQAQIRREIRAARRQRRLRRQRRRRRRRSSSSSRGVVVVPETPPAPEPSFIDLVALSHEFSDHAHRATLAEVAAEVPVVAADKAAELVRGWRHFGSVATAPAWGYGEDPGQWRRLVLSRTVRGVAAELPDWLAVARIVTPGNNLYYHSALALVFDLGAGRGAEAVIYSPHGVAPTSLSAFSARRERVVSSSSNGPYSEDGGGEAEKKPGIAALALLHGLHDVRIQPTVSLPSASSLPGSVADLAASLHLPALVPRSVSSHPIARRISSALFGSGPAAQPSSSSSNGAAQQQQHNRRSPAAGTELKTTLLQLNLGAPNAASAARLCGARWWVATHDEVKRGAGLVSLGLWRRAWRVDQVLGCGDDGQMVDGAGEDERARGGEGEERRAGGNRAVRLDWGGAFVELGSGEGLVLES